MLPTINVKSFLEVAEDDLKVLVENADYRESDYIDYKRNFAFLEVSMPFLFCMFSPFKKCSFLVKKILLIKQCIDSFLFFFHEFFPFF